MPTVKSESPFNRPGDAIDTIPMSPPESGEAERFLQKIDHH